MLRNHLGSLITTNKTSVSSRYKVEHCDTTGKWVQTHRRMLKTYSAALSKRDRCSHSRIMVDHAGNGVWEEVEHQQPKIDNTCPECEGSGDGAFGATCGECDGDGAISMTQAESA